MAGFTQYRNLLVAIATATFLAAVGADASGIGFNFHHRHSTMVQRWAEARGHAPNEPHEGSPEYYSALSHQDRTLFARRGLVSQSTTLTFTDGNVTTRLDGYLHYAEVEVGTPSTKFLVGLDTGSNYFWVPCECKLCAPTGSKADMPYSPRRSSTSKTVTCANALCDHPDACIASNSTSCPYEAKYSASANTGSSGVLVEDVLYLTHKKQSVVVPVQAPIVFGCGQKQTGDLMDGSAAGGLMGLGMDKVSVPSALASSGLVASDSFSMCFSLDGVGRINFGDIGSQDQAETPFITGNLHPTYNISVTAVSVERKTLPVEFAAVVDSGTSFTYLSDPAYTFLTTNFNSWVFKMRTTFPGSVQVPFEYCYSVSPDQTEVSIPVVSLTTEGGALFPVTRPIVTIYNMSDHPLGYCLAVIKNGISESSMDIIGQNFMTGLKVVFNRERSFLGWEKFDCYTDIKMQDSSGPDAPSGIQDDPPVSPDFSSGIPDSAPVSPDSSPGPVATPFTPFPRQNNSSDGIASSSRHAFGGLPLMLLPVLATVVMA